MDSSSALVPVASAAGAASWSYSQGWPSAGPVSSTRVAYAASAACVLGRGERLVSVVLKAHREKGCENATVAGFAMRLGRCLVGAC